LIKSWKAVFGGGRKKCGDLEVSVIGGEGK